MDKGSCHAQSCKLSLAVHTVYEKIQKPRGNLEHEGTRARRDLDKVNLAQSSSQAFSYPSLM
jgi:hypothetical protein